MEMHRVKVGIVFCLACAAGGPLNAAGEGEEKRVRETFAAFADAVKAKDGARIWKILDKDSQTAANRAARTLKATYENAGADGKAKLEKATELTGPDFAKLTGESFLKSKGFYGKYHEVPGSKIDTVVIDGSKATVNYTEEDGDKEKLRLVKDGEQWKVTAPMPPLPKL
jgi:hypothetical protein